MKRMKSMLLSALVTAGSLGLFGAEAIQPSAAGGASSGAAPAIEASAEVTQSAAKPAKDPLKQLRGKLLYERNRIRKLERAAEASHPELAEQIREMDSRREALYVSFEPKLEERYANEKSLMSQVETMTTKKKQ